MSSRRRLFPRSKASLRFLLATAQAIFFSFQAQAATLPTGFSETVVASGLSAPTAMAFAPDGRLFVCEQGGQLRVIKDGVLLPTPFVSLSVSSPGERGLLGVTVDPNFSANGYVYLYYAANSSPPRNRVVRWTANGDVAAPGSEALLLELNYLGTATYHNGGALHFGADAKLYVAVGDNTYGSNSQSLTNLFGKLLRINRDGSIPSDNPFFGVTTGDNRAIWALGLRNPFTFAFQPGVDRLFINDVGQSTWEEINDGVAGANYGWPESEGPTNDPRFRTPIFAYGRTPSATGGCAITGGAFYNPAVPQFPSTYVGKYFFADFCSGWIRYLNPANNSAVPFASGIENPVDIQVGPDGALYYLARGSSQIFRVQSDLGGVAARPDFNADGQSDLIWQNTINGQRGVWFMNGTSSGGELFLPSVSLDWEIAGTGDFNGDGQSDIIWQNTATGERGVWFMNGATYIGERFLPTVALDWQIATTGDFNGDGKVDLVWQNISTGQRGVWFMDGTTRVSVFFFQSVPVEWEIAAVADFNRDGQTDLLWQNRVTGERGFWLMNGTAHVGTVFLPTIPVAWRIAGAGDFNGDGQTDILWQNVSTGERGLWFMNETTQSGVFFLPTVAIEWDIRNR